MLKRIEKAQIRVGMFIEAVEGFTGDQQFPRARFLVSDMAAVENLRRSQIGGAIINTARGADLSGAAASSAHPTVDDICRRRSAKNTINASIVSLSQTYESIIQKKMVAVEELEAVARHISDELEGNAAIFFDMTRLKTKDTETFVHSLSVCALLWNFGRHLRFTAGVCAELALSGLLHDIGKLYIPDSILKKQGALTDRERAMIQRHPILGTQILVKLEKVPPIVIDICRHHHERVDGTGYPYGLPGSELTVYAKMAAICDVYDAVTSVRPYREPWSSQDAIKWMLSVDGHFDKELLTRFIISLP